MAQQNRVSGVFELIRTIDGDTIGGSLMAKGNTEQQYDTASQKYIPDYTITSNQLEIFPNFTSHLEGGAIPSDGYTDVEWYWKGTKITSSTPGFEIINGTAITPPTLKIKGNIMTEKGTYSIMFKAKTVKTNSSITSTKGLSLTEATFGSGVFVYLQADNGGIVDSGKVGDEQNCTVTPHITVNGATVTSGYKIKYYELTGNDVWVPFPASQTSPVAMTTPLVVRPEDVDGTELFKVEVFEESNLTKVVASDVIMIIDNSDALYMTMNQNRTLRPTSGDNSVICTFYVFSGSVDKTSQFSFSSINLIDANGNIQSGPVVSTANRTITINWDHVKNLPGTVQVTASATMAAGTFAEPYNNIYDTLG